MGLTVPCGLKNTTGGLHLHLELPSSLSLLSLFITMAAGGNQITVKSP